MEKWIEFYEQNILWLKHILIKHFSGFERPLFLDVANARLSKCKFSPIGTLYLYERITQKERAYIILKLESFLFIVSWKSVTSSCTIFSFRYTQLFFIKNMAAMEFDEVYEEIRGVLVSDLILIEIV